LDHAKPEVAELLLGLGAKHDVWSASAHGRLDVLRELLEEDPSLVNAPGGDGQRPLHVAKNAEVAEFLIDRGADLEQKDVDHEGTPAQYQINNSEVLRVLMDRGAKPDVFIAAVTNDVTTLRRLLKEDPDAAVVSIGKAPFTTVKSNGGHIYGYNLGFGKTPHLVAAEHGSAEVLQELERVSPAIHSLLAAAWVGDEATVRRLKGAEIGSEYENAIAMAAQHGRTEAVRLLLEAGFDPLAKGMDSGTALHVACWFGYTKIVRLLVPKVPLDLPDANHGSPPLGWTCHGAQWCRNAKGDYVAVVETLLAAGANPNAPANSEGTPMLKQAGDREDVKAVLRRVM
ncbi:ankyrin repeat domain-containing protein, partial [bacterium]